MRVLKMLRLCVPVTGLLDHTTKWLTQAAADLTTLPPTCLDAPDSSSVACLSPNMAASNPEPLSPTMVLSQGFLNLLLWDPENEEFPEVGRWGHFVLRTSSGPSSPDSLPFPASSDPADGQNPASGAGVAAAAVNHPGLRLASG